MSKKKYTLLHVSTSSAHMSLIVWYVSRSCTAIGVHSGMCEIVGQIAMNISFSAWQMWPAFARMKQSSHMKFICVLRAVTLVYRCQNVVRHTTTWAQRQWEHVTHTVTCNVIIDCSPNQCTGSAYMSRTLSHGCKCSLHVSHTLLHRCIGSTHVTWMHWHGCTCGTHMSHTNWHYGADSAQVWSAVCQGCTRTAHVSSTLRRGRTGTTHFSHIQ